MICSPRWSNYESIAAAGIFDPSAVTRITAAHEAGDEEASRQVWLMLQFELWRERWLEGSTAVSVS